MQSSSIRRRLPQLTLIFAAFIVGAFLFSSDSAEDAEAIGRFQPDTDVGLCDQFSAGIPQVFPAFPPVCADTASGIGAVSDVTNRLDIASGDYNFALTISAIPPNAFLAAGPGHADFTSGAGCAGGVGTCPEMGEILAQLVSDTRLGLTNNPSNSALTIPFTMINATVNNAAGNVWVPLTTAVAGSQGTLENMHTDTGGAATCMSGGGCPSGADGVDNDLDALVDEANETLPANGLSSSVERYPNYINALFDPDFRNWGADKIIGTADDASGNGPLAPVQPRARVVGNSVVAGSAVSLDFLYFANNTLADAFPAPHPFADTRDMGAVSVTVLQNPSAPAAPSSITDFSTKLSTLSTAYGLARENPCNGFVGAPCNTTGGIIGPLFQDQGVSDPLADNTATTLSDTVPPQGWPVGHWVGQEVVITSGPGAGQVRTISANAANVLTVSVAWTTIPDGSGYYIRPVTVAPANTRYMNPPVAGTYAYHNYSQSLRDSDSDGTENALDTCATTATPLVRGTVLAPNDANTITVASTAGAVVGQDLSVDITLTAGVTQVAGSKLYTGRTITAIGAGTIDVAPDWDVEAAQNPLDTDIPVAGDQYSIGFEPRANNPANDTDADNIPDAAGPGGGCDVVIAPGQNQDTDLGANGSPWQNAGDNCPLVSNGDGNVFDGIPDPLDQLESEIDHSYYEAFATNPAPQGGPKTDGVGDACDADDVRANGDFVTMLGTFKCIGGTDVDGDGWCATSVAPGIVANDADASGMPCDAPAGPTCAGRVPEDFDAIIAMPVAMAGSGDNPGLANAETGAQCTAPDSDDDDGDFYVNDGCAAVAGAEIGPQCTNATDDDGGDGGLVNDGCLAVMERQPVQVCNDGIDNDGDGLVDNIDNTAAAANSTCRPTGNPDGPAESTPQCAAGGDSDGDGVDNDGCPIFPNPTNGSEITRCANALDDDLGDGGLINDGCPVIGTAETACAGAADDDMDDFINDGCAAVAGSESICDNGLDDEAPLDGIADDGCPETGADCGNGADDDADTRINDGCPPAGPGDADGDGYPDKSERHMGTNPLERCEPAGAAKSLGWAGDFANGGGSADRVSGIDVSSFTSPPPTHYNTGPGDAVAGFDVRFDVLPGNAANNTDWIVLGDILALTAGETVFPAMSLNAKVFAPVAGAAYLCTAQPVFGG